MPRPTDATTRSPQAAGAAAHAETAGDRRLHGAAAGILTVALLAAPTATVLEGLAIVPVLTAAAVLAGGCALAAGWRPRRPDRRVLAGVAAILLWCAAATSWSPRVVEPAVTLAQAAATVIAGYALVELVQWEGFEPGMRSRLRRALVAGVVLAAVVCLVEMTLDHPIYRLFAGRLSESGIFDGRTNRGYSLLAMLLWPALIGLGAAAGRLRRPALAVAAVIAALALSESGTTQAAFAGALAAVALARWRPRLAVRALPAVLVAAVLAMPWLAEAFALDSLKSASWVPFSLQHRLFIWQHVAEWVFQKPVFGWGFAASEHLPAFDAAAFKGKKAAIPLHPHNAALQLWLELGLVGVVAGCGLLVVLFRRLARYARPTRELLLGAAVTTVLIALPGYGLWQTHWVAAIVWTWVAAAVVLAERLPPRPPA